MAAAQAGGYHPVHPAAVPLAPFIQASEFVGVGFAVPSYLRYVDIYLWWSLRDPYFSGVASSAFNTAPTSWLPVWGQVDAGYAEGSGLSNLSWSIDVGYHEPTFTDYAFGGLQIIGGMMQLVVGAGFFALSVPAAPAGVGVLSFVAGGVQTFKGIDNIFHGWQRIIGGGDGTTWTAQTVSAISGNTTLGTAFDIATDFVSPNFFSGWTQYGTVTVSAGPRLVPALATNTQKAIALQSEVIWGMNVYQPTTSLVRNVFAGTSASVGKGFNFIQKMSPEEAAENKLTERDPHYLERGLHEFENHHPLMKGKTFREFWKERGFSNKEIERITVKLDKDIHRTITDADYWDDELFRRIADLEADYGRKLTKDEVLEQVEKLLDAIGNWSPR